MCVRVGRLSAPLPAEVALHPDISMIKVKKAAIPPRHCLSLNTSQAVGCPPWWCRMTETPLHIAARVRGMTEACQTPPWDYHLLWEILSRFQAKTSFLFKIVNLPVCFR